MTFSPQASEARLAGARILVAEDSRVQAQVTSRALEGAGWSVRVVTDGHAALDALGQEAFDLLITDWMMPSCDGLELCRSIRGREELAGLYLLFLTSLDDKEQVVQALSAGADDYLVKPFHPGELVARVRAGLRLVELQRELRSANDALERLAMTDALTGLPNRRAFDDLIAMEMATFARRDEPFCVVMIDLDGFKTVNDQHGHETGDLLLAGVARALHRGVREGDVAARLGGDEFVLILRDCTTDQAIQVCERVRSRLAGVRVATPSGGYVSPAASMGIAEIWKASDVGDLLASADEALYTAKRLGGNVVRTSSLARTG